MSLDTRNLPALAGVAGGAYIYGNNVGINVPSTPEDLVTMLISVAFAIVGFFIRRNVAPVLVAGVLLSGCAVSQRDIVIQEQAVEGVSQALCAGLRGSEQYDTALTVAQSLALLSPEDLRSEFDDPQGLSMLVPLMRTAVLREVTLALQRAGVDDPERRTEYASRMLARAVRGCLRGLVAR